MMAINAAYEGRCEECGARIRVGEAIVRSEDDGWQHERCPVVASRLDLQPGEIVCPDCFMVQPCPCQDGL